MKLSLHPLCFFFITYNLWGGFCLFWIFILKRSSYCIGCEHLWSNFEIILFDQWLFMSTIIIDISILNLINVRCFRMCQILGFHFFILDNIGCFCIVLYFLFYSVGVLVWTFLSNIYNLFFGFSHLPTLSFCKIPHFLIFNNLHKGSNRLSSRGICHGHFFGLGIASKIECNNMFISCI